ncbi:MAG: hypothetical protein LH615_08810 [Ferruginibacter sp.]|nr:hypothetical protein [Ferruginibacter sp.]
MKNFSFLIACSLFYYTGLAQKNTTLTALFDKATKNTKLRWQHIDKTITAYVLQSSKDNSVFTDIFLKNTAAISLGDFIKFTDNKPAVGKNYYRLKIFRNTNFYETTTSVMLVKGNTENAWVIYPVPVGAVLNLQYNGNGPINGVINIVIQSVTSGTIFTKLRLASTTRNISIPVSNIGRGTYDIRIYIGNEVVWNQRFVK